MAGITEQGLVIKRQNEVLTDLRNDAVPIFQDLVPAGDVVDTGDSSTIGRLTGLWSVPLSDLWLLAQQVYFAFDPNSATGIALDNLVAYAGLTRNPPSSTTATVVVWGDEATFIPALTSQVRATDNTLYEISSSIEINSVNCIGFRATLSSVVSGTTYQIFIESGSVNYLVQYTANPSDTVATVLANLADSANTYSNLTATSTPTQLQVETVDVFEYINVTSPNVLLTKIKARGEVRNTEVGAKTQDANTITNIATPVLGWDSVNNPSDATVGEDRETDEELRLRFRDSKFLRAQNISDALYAALLELDGVRQVAIYENESSVYDAVYDLPPHSFKAVVLGGVPTDIATAIWHNKPLGIGAEGNTSAIIFDSQGFERTIEFDRPVPVNILISMQLTVNNQLFPSNGPDLIKAALVEYFQENFGIGDDVIYSRLYTPINSISGHQVDFLFLGTASSSGTSNITIGYNEIANLSPSNISITIV